MLKRIISSILTLVLFIGMLPIIPLTRTSNSAYYPEGWKTWQQGYDARWSYIPIGSSTVGYVGCWLSSFCKMYIQAGLIDDNEKDFDIAKYVNWVKAKGGIGPAGDFTSYILCLSYPDGELKFNRTDPIYCATQTKQQLIETFTQLRNEGKMIHIRQAGHHTICVGDPIINENGEPDIELYDTATSLAHPTMMNLPEYVSFYEIYERVDGKPAYPGTSVESKRTDDAISLENSDESSATPLYRLSRYNEKQRESLALMMNKKINNYELSAIKWNMIVSQFTIPYVQNINDTLSSNNWKEISKSISNVNWEKNPYLECDNIDVDNNFMEATQDYINYLKSNSNKLNTVLDLLANKKENVYTRLYTSNKVNTATVKDLYNDSALYLHDNITLTGDAVKLKSDNKDDTVEIVNNNESDEELEETEELLLEEVVEDKKKNSSVITEPLDLWSGLSEMYDITIDSAKNAYKSILKQSAVTTINVPVYVATDSTELYNSIFVSNAMEYLGDYKDDANTKGFIEEYADKPIYMDRWGNICAEVSIDKYVLVYPSYANPLFVSCELDNNDIAGVYYESLDRQLSKYDLTLKKDEKKQVLMFKDSEVQVTVEDAVKHIKDYEPTSKDTYIFGETDSFRVTQGLNNNGSNIEKLSFNRLDNKLLLGEDGLPFYRFDTTTLAFANKTLLTMMNRNEIESKSNSWYSELSKPVYDMNDKDYELVDLIGKEKTSEGKLTLERFGVHAGLNVGEDNSTRLNISSDGDLYSFYNGGNIIALSKWKTDNNSKVVSEYFDSGKTETKTLDSSGAMLGYIDNFIKLVNYTKPIEYPFMMYFNGIKNIYETEYNKRIVAIDEKYLDIINKKVLVSETFNKQSTFDVESEKNIKVVSMFENLYTMEYLDSERFNIYFTTNTGISNLSKKALNNLEEELEEELGEEDFEEEEVSKVYNRALYGTYLLDITYNNLSKGIAKPDSKPKTDRKRLLSVPILSTVVDDTTSWGVWTGDEDKIGRNRTIDTNKIVDKGMLSPTPKTIDNGLVVDSDYNTSGLKYTLSNEIVSSVLNKYPIEDIISVAYIWDSYYIPNSPIGRKLDTKSVNQDGTLYDADTVITPYNGIHDDNNNTLFWTRETNGSIDLQIYTKIGDDAKSTFTAYRDIYEVQYNVPMFLLAVNKNADNTNLAIWVKNLEYPASTSVYVMDLISAFLKNPISGFRNLFLGLAQWLHGMLSKGSFSNIFNLESVSNMLWNEDRGTKLNFFIIIYSSAISIILIIILLKYMVARIKNGLGKKLLRAVALGFVPLLLVHYTGKAFNNITSYLMEPVVNKILLTELEGSKRGNSKIQFGTDGEILLDTVTYNQESFDSLKLNMLIDIDSFGNKTFEEVSLADLYESITYDAWVNNTDYLATDSKFGGLNNNDIAMWYNTEEFVPVNYAKYKDTVFYYFYDWIKSNYIMYNSYNNPEEFIGYNKPDDTVEYSVYVGNIENAEQSYLDLSGGLFGMFTNEEFIKTNNDYSDIFGLSNLFKMTSDNGFPVNSYNKDSYLTDWSTDEYNNTITRLSDYESLVGENADMLNVSPISAIIQSVYWKEYKEKSHIHVNKYSDNMSDYTFTPDYIQNTYNPDKLVNFDDKWTENLNETLLEESSRIPFRLYASKGLLLNNLNKDELESDDFLIIENDLFKLNRTIYADILNLYKKYEDSNISDDTMIFVSALIATFDFNKSFGGDLVSINLNTVSSDKMFRVIYATEIEDVIDNPNLVYMIYDNGGLFTALLFFIAELLFIISMYLRCMVYFYLIIVCLMVCFSDCFLKEEKFKNIMSGLLTQLGVLLLSQIIILVLIRLGLELLSKTSSQGVLLTATLLFAVISFALIRWTFILFKSLVKSFRDFGFAVFNDEIFGLKTVINKANMDINRLRMHDFSGRGIRDTEYSGNKEKRDKVYQTKIRLHNMNKLNRQVDDEDDDL